MDPLGPISLIYDISTRCHQKLQEWKDLDHDSKKLQRLLLSVGDVVRSMQGKKDVQQKLATDGARGAIDGVVEAMQVGYH